MAKAECECSTLGVFHIVGMGDSEGRDKRIFASLENVINYGEDKWWLYVSRCSACGQDWMIAQEERIHDFYYLRRLSHDEMQKISAQNEWPPDFLSFEEVIKLGPDNSHVATFFDANDLTDTIKELMEARAEITASEVAYLFCLSEREAKRLMDRARRMTWSQLRPFA
ncbi:hypothetical protein [Qipengyuania soli]|uniref:Uncharacterized protein n=1 Tax=Qipengyuania soli TaxID=2782568 RepID=A0A7S8F6Q9_9SPHN|nr:hypothetical protein [Qipengyuania soli]QPD00152.1 hypothetical protein IRL76_06385 [Qipengyuania soli]